MAADDSSSSENETGDDSAYGATRMGRTRTNAHAMGSTRQNSHGHGMPRSFDSEPSRRDLGMWDEQAQPTIWDAVNYPRESEFEFDSFYLRYTRQSEAQAIIDKPVNDTWQSMPKVHDEAHQDSDKPKSEFEKRVREFFEGEYTRRKPIHRLNVLDRLARLGEYSVMVLGFADGRDVDTPVAGVDGNETIPEDRMMEYAEDDGVQVPENMSEGEFDSMEDLMYLAVYAEDRVQKITLNTDMSSQRFRLPQKFEIVVQDVDDGDELEDGDEDYQTEEVHWSRVIHVPEGTLEDDLHGVPALKSVFHELLNIDKIKAASGEGFWRAGYSGLHVRPPEGRDGVPMEFEDGGEGVHQEIQDFMNNLDRTLSTPAEINSIDNNVGNPMPHLEANYQSIAAAKDIPKSILTGEDRADTADATDVRKWHQKIGQRRNNHAEAVILEPIIQRLIDVGCLPEPEGDGFVIEWEPLDELSEQQERELQKMLSQTIKNLSGNNPLQFAEIPELRQAIGWDPNIGGEVNPEQMNEEAQEESQQEEEANLEVDENVLPDQTTDELDYPEELYDTPREAEARAEELGISGYHVMRVEGETKYMPGETHDQFLEAMEAQSAEQSEEDPEVEQSDEEEEEPATTNRALVNAEEQAPLTHGAGAFIRFESQAVEDGIVSVDAAAVDGSDYWVEVYHVSEDGTEQFENFQRLGDLAGQSGPFDGSAPVQDVGVTLDRSVEMGDELVAVLRKDAEGGPGEFVHDHGHLIHDLATVVDEDE